METDPVAREEEVYSFLSRRLRVVDFALRSFYELSQEEAEQAEQRLSDWFHFFAGQPGWEEVPAKDLEEMLLVVACRYARDSQLEKMEGEPPDTKLGRLVKRAPEEVAHKLAKRLKEEREKVRQEYPEDS